MLDNVAQDYAEICVKEFFILFKVQTVIYSKKKIANKGIAKKTKCEFAK